MGVPNCQLTTNFSAKCQLTTIFWANCQLTTNGSSLLTFLFLTSVRQPSSVVDFTQINK